MVGVLKIFISVVICLKMVECCDCNLEAMIKDSAVSSSNAMEKRQMRDDGEDDAEDAMTESETTEDPISFEARFNEASRSTNQPNKTKKQLFKSGESKTKSKGFSNKNVCYYFKEAPNFNLEKMVDVWRIAFFKASEKLSCFKIHIRTTTKEDRMAWHNMYGNFNGSINWSNCQFEVASSALKIANSEQKHFLEGSKKDRGVFKNVIVVKEEDGDLVTLLEQSPDQWLVIKNLLLMRDCDNGDVVVFSRLPYEPSIRDIEDALAVFGEDTTNGTVACETLRDPKYHTLS